MEILHTQRLYIRKIRKEDYEKACLILQDIEVMYAWEHSFSNEEVRDWLDENIKRYKLDGYSYWAVIEKQTDQLIGFTGIIKEQVEDKDYVGIGYIFKKSSWGKGYAFEAASHCMEYGFNSLKLKEITAQIRPNNKSSIKLAQKLGMKVKKQFVRRYKNKDIPHLLYSKIRL